MFGSEICLCSVCAFVENWKEMTGYKENLRIYGIDAISRYFARSSVISFSLSFKKEKKKKKRSQKYYLTLKIQKKKRKDTKYFVCSFKKRYANVMT
jgi:hypothetical protein